jgi:hypothetical protein
VTTKDDLPVAQSIDTVPRVLKQANLLGLPDGATTDEPELENVSR